MKVAPMKSVKEIFIGLSGGRNDGQRECNLALYQWDIIILENITVTSKDIF